MRTLYPILVFALSASCTSNDGTVRQTRPALPAPAVPDAARELEQQPSAPRPDASAGPTRTTDAAAPSPASAQPVEIVVRNLSGAPTKLDVTFGEAAFLGLIDIEGELVPLTGLDAPSHCECLCGQKIGCSRCARPGDRYVDVPSGGEHRYAWNGRARRPGKQPRGCVEPFVPPAGRYLFRVCGEQRGGCVVEEVELPASQPIVLTLDGRSPRVGRCPLDRNLLLRAGRTLLYKMRRNQATDEMIAACDVSATRCVAENAVPAPPTLPGACTLVVIPRGDELEVRALLPPTQGRHIFRAQLDARAVSVQFVAM